jgi:REP element-mobilizing transposase RayT
MKCNQQIFEWRWVVIDTLVLYANKFGIPIYSFAVGHDHIHFVTKVPSREAYVKFIRAVTACFATCNKTGTKPAGECPTSHAEKRRKPTAKRPNG